MRSIRYIGAILALLVVFLQEANAGEETDTGLKNRQVDVNEIVFGHIGDSYEWHITDIGATPVAIPLPVIVKSNRTGWHIFLSSRFEEENGEYKGLYIAKEGEYKGKIVEKDANGREVKPLDISITKNVAGLFINSTILVILVLGCARWYRRHPVEKEAPKGIVGMMEACILSINEDVIRGCIGKDYRRYSPYLLTAFFFILVNNLMGLIPFFPGGANITGNIAITLVLAVCTFLAVNIWGNKEYWKEILWPDVPWWLKVPFPMMPVIELFGIFTKPFALMIRLFANMMAGHAAILSLISIIFITANMGPLINGSMGLVAVVFGIFMTALELLVAFIQAYVFTMLSAVFIGLSRQEAHGGKEIR
ncbi:MAG: F0F1 ATP synthase subunit A [Phocaeicola sp.]|uniref:F0F1 ATP synthase subunit A n=1 Tax=Phocaeicola sp. TaxID=2773926 RepID=UPI0023CC6C78|nr:F0F1 ATP synthase subunit A [Phocaeicola sp.]MDE5676622.1 F0F1 ATP synthase subunit A [Phocaeicola sp.]MDE6180645.1 F0F1 ATP synthase subunit A [Phocaeicola sp.]